MEGFRTRSPKFLQLESVTLLVSCPCCRALSILPNCGIVIIPGVDTLSTQPAWRLPFLPGVAGIISLLPVSSGDTSQFFQWLCLVFLHSTLQYAVGYGVTVIILTSEQEREEAHRGSKSLLLPKCLCQPAPHGPRAPCEVCGRGSHLLACAPSVSPTTMVLRGSQPSNGTVECWEQKLQGDGETSHPSQAALVPSWLQKGSRGPEAAEVGRNEVYWAQY